MYTRVHLWRLVKETIRFLLHLAYVLRVQQLLLQITRKINMAFMFPLYGIIQHNAVIIQTELPTAEQKWPEGGPV